MSEDSGQNTTQTPDGATEQTANVDELMSRLDKLEAHNRNLTADVKQWREKAKSARTEMESKETERMQEANDFKGLYEKSMEQINELRSQINDEKKVNLKKSFHLEVAKYGADAQDADLLVAALNSKSDRVAYDKDANKWEGIPEAISELKSEKPFLFRQEQPTMVSSRPQQIVDKERTLEDEIRDNPSAVLDAALKKHFT